MADIKETNFEFVAGESIATMSTAESKLSERMKHISRFSKQL